VRITVIEPKQRGRAAYNQFFKDNVDMLDQTDQKVTLRMSAASFSIFQVADGTTQRGLYLDDLRTPICASWLFHEGLEASASEQQSIDMRVFVANPFDAGFGMVVMPDAELTASCATSASKSQPVRVRHSLAAALDSEEIVRADLVNRKDVVDA
jgi:hypothetical protein